MNGDAEVHPDGSWHTASTATVIFRGKTYPNVPIVVINITPAKITVMRVQFPGGVVILNDLPPPGSQEPITLPVKIGKDEVILDIPYDGGWPTGVVVLWEDQLDPE